MSKLDQVIFAVIGLGALIVVIFLITLAYMNWPQPSVATLLPADTTVTYVEVNSLKLPTKLEAGQDKVVMAESLGQPFGLELIPALESFANDGLAFAMVKDGGRNHPLLFIKTRTKRGTLNYFDSLTLPNEELTKQGTKDPTYYYPQGQPFAFKFIKKYVVIAQSPDALALLDDLNGKTLSANENYVKSINNLTRRSWIL